jgi:hypothetical protein
MSSTLGAGILDLICKADGKNVVFHYKELEFANDGVFCEWAYVIDLDTCTFEVFSDSAKKKHAGSMRFADVGGDGAAIGQVI